MRAFLGSVDWRLLLFCVPLLAVPGGAASRAKLSSSLRTERVQSALDAAYGSLARASSLELDEAWLLQRYLLPRHTHRELATKVRNELPALAKRPGYGLLLVPSQPRPEVPKDLPLEGGGRLLTLMYSPFGDPEPLALERLREFAGEDGEEYVLTHQVLALVSWTEIGRELPPDLLARRERLLGELADEQRHASTWSDLYAERAAFLLLFGEDRCPPALPEWTRRALRAQEPDGSFGDHPWVWRYRGAEQKVRRPSHTTVLAAAILAAYLDCVRESEARSK